MSTLLDKIENREDICLYALDESNIQLEPRNYYSWSPVGKPNILEKNGIRKGFNLIGATEISKQFRTVYKAYPLGTSINAERIKDFLKYLLRMNPSKNVIVILDNAKSHTAKAIENFALMKRNRLHLIYLPTYSPQLNPQENMWKWLKDFCSQKEAFKNQQELEQRIKRFYKYVNKNPLGIKNRSWAKSFYK